MEIILVIIGVFLLTALASIGIAQNKAVREKLLVAIRAVDLFEVTWRDWFFAPLVRPIARVGIHPNVITLSGVALSGVLAAAFFKNADPLGIFLIAVVAALSDTFDGMVARAAGKVTALGGSLDGIRDFLLFIVLTVGILVYRLAPPTLIIAFFAGNALVGFLKLCEIFLRRDAQGFVSSVASRSSGEGKISIDRIKFACYALGCLAALLGQAGVEWIVVAVPVIFWVSTLSVFLSIAAHSVIIVSLLRLRPQTQTVT